MTLELLALGTAVLAAVPALLVLVNWRAFPRLPQAPAASRARVSLLVPARDEEASIGRCLAAARRAGELHEIVVMDDASADRTPEIVADVARRDPRVRLVTAPSLPSGWCGKQHACSALAATAGGDVLIFVDADVTLSSDAVPRIVNFLEQSGADLASGFPRQETATFFEWLLIPLVHFVLLGYLPMAGLQGSRNPAFAAGCGQLMAVRRAAYEASGGHAAIRASRHDGLALPRAFRRHGFSTLVFDATDVASCRMYRSAREVLVGLTKNATEGLAEPRTILPWTLLLVGGQVVPFLLLPWALRASAGTAATWVAAGVGAVLATRSALALRFGQPWWSVVLHPLGILVLVALQWYALIGALAGRRIAWKGRTA